MIIGLLQCDDVVDPLRVEHGNYPDMLQTLLGRVEPSLMFQVWQCHQGEFPDVDAGVDAWITTGSKCGANDDTPWIHQLAEFIRALWRAQQPLVGICFGHQLIAQALGGRVDRSTHGWGVGVMAHQIAVRQPWMTPWHGDTLRLLSSHQDQVMGLPQDAMVLAGSDFCPNYMVQHGHVFLGIQGHPEFSKAYASGLMERRRDIIPPERVDAGMQSLRLPVDGMTVGRWILNFMRQAAFNSTQHSGVNARDI